MQNVLFPLFVFALCSHNWAVRQRRESNQAETGNRENRNSLPVFSSLNWATKDWQIPALVQERQQDREAPLRLHFPVWI